MSIAATYTLHKQSHVRIHDCFSNIKQSNIWCKIFTKTVSYNYINTINQVPSPSRVLCLIWHRYGLMRNVHCCSGSQAICSFMNSCPRSAGWQDSLLLMATIEQFLTNYTRNCISVRFIVCYFLREYENNIEEWLVRLRMVYFRNSCSGIHRIEGLY
jgi:hypothetical protein